MSSGISPGKSVGDEMAVGMNVSDQGYSFFKWILSLGKQFSSELELVVIWKHFEFFSVTLTQC